MSGVSRKAGMEGRIKEGVEKSRGKIREERKGEKKRGEKRRKGRKRNVKRRE